MPNEVTSTVRSNGNASSSSSATKKRKRDPRVLSPQQPVISELFAASQHKTSHPANGSEKPDTQSPTPTRKRSRIDPSSPRPVSPVTFDSMYAFPSDKSSKASAVVNLNSAPSSPPAVRKLAKMTLAGPHVGVKRIAVKNMRQPRSDPQSYYDQVVKKLDLALDSILRNEKQLPSSNEELYKGVENICKQGRDSDLYTRLRSRMKQQALSVKEGLKIRQAENPNDDPLLLRAILEEWAVWKSQWAVIKDIFFFLDRMSRLSSSSPSLNDLSVDLFLKKVLEHKPLRVSTLIGSCRLIEQGRSGHGFETDIVKSAVKLYNELGIYTKEFEPLILGESQRFASEWAEKEVLSTKLSEYVLDAKALMENEMKRSDIIGLSSSTKRSLLALLEEHLVMQQKTRLVDLDDIADLLDDNQVDSLKSLYQLLRRCNLCEKLRPAFDSWINATGTQIVFDDKHEDEMVVKLLTLKRQLDFIWINAFARNSELMHGLRESFEHFINKTKKSSATHGTDNSKPGEMIAKYVDLLLRGGSKAIPAALSKAPGPAGKDADEEDNEVKDEDSEVNEQLDQVLDIFRFLHGKAVFEAFYKKDLARRLLMGRSASADAEVNMLTRLKNECGSGFTANLEKMFKDIELSREEMAEYKARQAESNDGPAVDLFVNVLSASAWPSYPDIPVNIPHVVKAATDRFERSYQNHHTGRKLDWKHGLAHCQLVGRFPRGIKELVVSGFQAIVLLLFSKLEIQDALSYEQIKAETGLPENELKRTLQSLACAKLRPLRKTPQSREINDGDTFTVNASFSHERYRVKINQVQLKETKEENKETHERVQADRNFETQAAIVRIMKSKKTIKHELLIAEVIEATRKRGVLSVQDIKSNIERLIEKEYMEREENNTYSYVS